MQSTRRQRPRESTSMTRTNPCSMMKQVHRYSLSFAHVIVDYISVARKTMKAGAYNTEATMPITRASYVRIVPQKCRPANHHRGRSVPRLRHNALGSVRRHRSGSYYMLIYQPKFAYSYKSVLRICYPFTMLI